MASNRSSLPPKYSVPPMPPTIHRQISLGRTDEGVVLLPPTDSSSEGVLIRWGVKGTISSWQGHTEELVQLGGILGVVRLWDNAYLLVFLPSGSRPLFPTQESGPYRVHTLGSIYSIPLHPDLSTAAITQLQSIQKSLRPKSPRKNNPLKWNFGINLKPPPAKREDQKGLAESADEESDGDDDYETDGEGYTTTAGSMSRESIAPEADEDPIAPMENKKRFSWNKFLPIRKPAKAPSAEKDLAELKEEVDEGESNTQDEGSPRSSADKSNQKPFPTDPPTRRDLETKIIRQITREFSSGGFFFSYNSDLTHSVQAKRRKLASKHHSEAALASLLNSSRSSIDLPSSAQTQTLGDDLVEPDIQVPLWRRADRRFFWNEWLMNDFIDKGLHAFILPVMQGWVQSSELIVDGVPIDFAVISRRSRERAGLRYQRRGIDDEGHVANYVETEMVVRAKVEEKVSLFSFVQVRGSIPLKWSQSPYSMKPPPVLDQPVDQSYSVANLHFNDLTKRHGHITIINLSEQTGKEAVVTNGYRDLVEQLERDDLTYKPFDFHAKCHGMKWENISELVGEVDFGSMGYFWSLSNEPLREQSGAFRTNCIDCLDRTNVVQSALARHVLTEMLTQLGLVPVALEVENVFNDVWANNGDMLSLCYAHTSALKGDFVRTGKRDLQGMLNDGISSLSRMFYGAVSDFFAQTVISFFLGHRSLGVFSEFLQSLENSNATNVAQMSRLRAAAIETSSARVISEDERRLAGWVLLSPEERGITLSSKLEEKILLLTNVAIYVASFNYSLDKVSGFTRIPLASVTALQHGAYIISALQEAGRDPKENAGFMMSFSTENESTRYSTYSIRNNQRRRASSQGEDDSPAVPGTPLVEDTPKSSGGPEFYAFKVLPLEIDERVEDDDNDDDDDQLGGIRAVNCQEQAGKIVRRIHRQCQKVSEKVENIVEKDVVSLAEAERSTGLFAKMDYAVKRFLWLSKIGKSSRLEDA